jgi:hypothetical protein
MKLVKYPLCHIKVLVPLLLSIIVMSKHGGKIADHKSKLINSKERGFDHGDRAQVMVFWVETSCSDVVGCHRLGCDTV